MRWVLPLFVVGVFLSVPGLAHAQDEAPDEESRPDPGDDLFEVSSPEALETIPVGIEGPAAPPEAATELEDVVVTAQKFKQPLAKVPVSVSAIDGSTIQQVGAADLADVSLYIPNVRVDPDDLGSPQIFIRGFGTNAFNPSFEGSVAFVQDEIYFGRPGYFTEAMFDIDRLEVLRGPQGTLFGKNSVAGVFNVFSRGADEPFNADARLFGGQDNELRFEGGVGGLFDDWAGARVAALYRTQDGGLRNQFLQRDEEALDQHAARVKLHLFPLAGLDSELTVVTSNTEAPFWPFQLMRLDDDTRTYLEGFDPDIEDDPTDFVTSFDTPGFIEKGSDTGGLKTQWEIGELGPLQDFTSVLVLGASTFFIDQLNELDVSPADIARLDNHEDHEQLSGEIRFTGRTDSLFGLGSGLEFVAGAFWFDSNYVLLARVLAGQDLGSYVLTDDFAQLAAEDSGASSTGFLGLGGLSGLGTPGAALTDGDYYQFDFVQDIEATAVFGQFTWYLGEHWAITPGVRLNQEKKRVDTAGQAHCQGDALGQPCFMQQLLSAENYDHRNLTRSEDDVSPKLALQYFSDHEVNYYASYARGYKSGGVNSISFGRVCEEPGNDLSCRPVEARELEYEPENATTYEVGAKGKFFDRTLGINITLYDTQFDNLQVLAFNGVFFDVSNAATATSSGLEADFLWLTPFAPLRVFGSLGLLDAKYDSYPEAPAPISEGINQQQDLSGRRIAFAPRTTATLMPTLTFLFGEFIGTFAVDVLHQGDQYTDTDLDPNTYVPAYTKYSARVGFGSVAGTWGVSIGGTNLTDERVLNQVTDAPFFPGTFFAQQASGRQFYAVLSLQL